MPFCRRRPQHSDFLGYLDGSRRKEIPTTAPPPRAAPRPRRRGRALARSARRLTLLRQPRGRPAGLPLWPLTKGMGPPVRKSFRFHENIWVEEKSILFA